MYYYKDTKKTNKTYRRIPFDDECFIDGFSLYDLYGLVTLNVIGNKNFNANIDSSRNENGNGDVVGGYSLGSREITVNCVFEGVTTAGELNARLESLNRRLSMGTENGYFKLSFLDDHGFYTLAIGKSTEVEEGTLNPKVSIVFYSPTPYKYIEATGDFYSNISSSFIIRNNVQYETHARKITIRNGNKNSVFRNTTPKKGASDVEIDYVLNNITMKTNKYRELRFLESFSEIVLEFDQLGNLTSENKYPGIIDPSCDYLNFTFIAGDIIEIANLGSVDMIIDLAVI